MYTWLYDLALLVKFTELGFKLAVIIWLFKECPILHTKAYENLIDKNFEDLHEGADPGFAGH